MPPRLLPVVLVGSLLSLVQAAPLYQFDFNGMPQGDLNGQVDDSPNTVGSWAGRSAVPEVVSGSLTAPTGLNYGVSPGGAAGRFEATRTDDAFRGQFHRVVPAGGVVWVSALVRADGSSAAAVTIDGGDTNNAAGWTLQNKGGFGVRPNPGTGTTELFWSDDLSGLDGAQSVTLSVDTAGRTALVLARIDLGGTGTNVDLWLNPVLVDVASLPEPDLRATTKYNVVEWIGAGAVATGLTGYRVEFDNILCANDALEEISFAEVCGLPVPERPPPPPGVMAPRFDFDDLAVGTLRGQADDSPDALGDWSGVSTGPTVSVGNLSAPAGTNYNVPSGGSPGRVFLSHGAGPSQAQFHQVSPGDGVIWFSALLYVGDGAAAAITIDGAADQEGLTGKAGAGLRPDRGSGSAQLFWSDDLDDPGTWQAVELPHSYAGETVLLLGRVALGAAGQNVDLWLNPALDGRGALGESGDLEARTMRTRVDWVGFGSLTGAAPVSLFVDNLLLSNDRNEDTAFYKVTGVLPPPSFGAADVNGNGLADLAELLHPAVSEFPPETDSDLDGFTNAQEAVAGTDPFDKNSRLETVSVGPGGVEPGSFEFSFSSVAGVRYAVEVSDDLQLWAPVRELVAGGPLSSVMIPVADLPPGGRAFARAAVLPPLDRDSDGLEDGLEEYLGFDPDDPISVRAAGDGGDLQQFVAMMSGGNPQGGLFGSGAAGVPSAEQASRFLAQATFGPSLDRITALRSLGPNAYEIWIDEQLALPPSLLRSYIDILVARMESDSSAPDYGVFPHYVTSQTSFAMFRENVNTGWMRQALFAPDELRQRVAWALSQVVVVGPRCNSYGIAAADWYDTVLRHSFGSYRDLLYDIAVHPWMGWYLSHLGNRKADPAINRLPDENFAREIMQLFSIGLWQLHMDGTRVLDEEGEPIPAYTNEDIVQLARVFTGLELQAGATGQGAYAQAPMRMVEERHDTGDAVMAGVYGQGEKTFLGASLPAFSDDPGRSGLEDVQDAIEVLVNHPNCAPFVSKNLIQHLITSNPSPEYVGRVAAVFADDGKGGRGNLGAVVKAILLDPEARDLSAALDPAGGRLKGPMLRTVSVARAFEAGAATPALHDLSGIQFWSPRKTTMFGDFLEYPFEYPSVFNFYEPGYSRPGEVRELGLLSPEFQIMNALTATTVPNRLWWLVKNGFHNGKPSVTPEFRLQVESLRALSTDTEAMLDRLNLLLCHGSLGPEGRRVMREAIDFWNATDPNWKTRADLAVYLCLVAPDCAVLK